jgi:hypothetical protein
MAEPVGALRVELEVSTAQFTADLGKAKDAARRFSEGTGNAFMDTAKSIDVTSKSMRAMTTSARFVTSTLGSELNPIVTATASEFLSLGSVAAAMGGSMATIAGTAGVGALVVALGFLVKEAIDAAKRVKDLFDALETGDIAVMEKALNETNKLINQLEVELIVGISLWRRFWLAGTGELAEDILKEEVDLLKKHREELGLGIITTKEMAQADKDRLSIMEQLGNEAKEAAGKELQAREKTAEAAKSLRDLMAQVAAETRSAAGEELAGIVKSAETMATATAEAFAAEDTKRWADAVRDANEAIKEGRGPIEIYSDAVARLQQLRAMDLLTLDQFSRALAVAGSELMKAEKASAGAEDAARRLGLTFQSAFEQAIIDGNNLSDVLFGLLQDIERIILRMTVTEPLTKGLAGIFGGGVGGLFGGGAGGGDVNALIGLIEGAGGFVSLQHGGVVPGPIDQPMLAVVHGGEMVTPHGESEGQDTINISVDARGAQRGVGVEVQRAIVAAMNQVRKEVVPIVDENLRRGGKFSWSVLR